MITKWATDQSSIRTWPCMNIVIFTHNLGNWLINWPQRTVLRKFSHIFTSCRGAKVSLILFVGCYLLCRRYVLGMSSGIDELGTLRWQLVVSLLAAWIFIFLALCKGVKSSGKASWCWSNTHHMQNTHTVGTLTRSPWVVALSWHGHRFGAGNVPDRELFGGSVPGIVWVNVQEECVGSYSTTYSSYNLCQPGKCTDTLIIFDWLYVWHSHLRKKKTRIGLLLLTKAHQQMLFNTVLVV